MLHALLLLSLIWCATANLGGDQCNFRRHGIIEGNITLGFMFPFFDSEDETSTACDETSIPNPRSIQLLEAATFALRRGQPRIPGITIGLEAYDSCSSLTVALDHSTFFLRDRFVGGPTEGSLGSCGEKLKPGFIGSLHDELGIVVGSFFSNSLVTVTGYAAELPQLTTAETYEYFTRTIPSDAEEIEVWTSFLQAAKWTRVSVVFSQGENQLTDNRLFEERVKSAMICISESYSLDDDADLIEMDSIYNLILQSDVDAVVLILEDDLGEDFLKAVSKRTNGRKMQFLVPFDLYLEIADIDLPDNVTVVGAVPDVTHPGSGDDAFDTYFKNLTHLTFDEVANPWFKYFWENSYGCAINSSLADGCGADAVARHAGTYERNPFVTTVIDAVDAHIEALATLLQCEEPPCDLTNIAFDPEDYLDTLKQVNLIRNEGGRSRSVSFTPNGDPADNKFLILLTSKNQDETLLYRWDNGKLSEPLFFGIADVLSPSECGDPCLDPSCFELRQMEEQAEAYSGGDIILGGLFPVSEWDVLANECGNLTGIGVLYVQAMLYAIDSINEDSNILPGIQIGMDGLNTCSSPQRAADIAHELATQGVFGGSSSVTRLSPDGKRLEHFFGVIGPKSLEETMAVNQITRSRKVPMIGYDTDSPTINSFSYKYFARVLPSLVSNIHPFLQYISRNDITYFQILYSGNRFQSPTSTVIGYLESGSWTGVCSAQAVQIPASVEGETENRDAWDDMFATLEKKSDAKAVYLALSNEDILRVLEQMQRRGLFGKFILLAGTTWELTEEEETKFAEVVRGAVIIKSVPRTYESFEEYIRKNLSLPDTRNPWLSDYCAQNSQGADCTGPTTVFENLMKDEAIPRIIDSTYAMAHALHIVQMMLCPGTTRVCKSMLEADGDTIFETLTRRTSFKSINDDREIRFDFSGSLTFAYEIFNYQQNRGMVRKEKVGNVQNWLFTDEKNVKFYDENGIEIQSSNATGSRCRHDTCVKGCQRPDHDAVAEISGIDGSGDVWIGGFFEVTEPAQDSIHCTDEIINDNVPLVEAFLYAIETINSDPTILPDLKLAGIAFDSCGSPNRVIKEVGNFIAGTIDYRSRFSSQQLNVFGIIGGGSSDTTAALSQTLADLDINQISYAATAVEFSDPLDHPYLLRTVPSDIYQAAAFVDILDYFSWKYVSVVYSDNLFGNDMLKEFTKRIAEDGTVCVAMTLKVQRETFSDADYDEIATTLQSNPSSRVVLMFTSDVDTRSVLQAASRMDINDLQWVGSDTWGVNEHVIANTSITALGALTISFESQRVPSFEDYFRNLYPWTYRRNPWFQSFYSDFFECDLSASHGYGVWCNVAQMTFPDEVISKNPLVVHVINAVYAYAHGLQAALDEHCKDETKNHICRDLLNQPEEFHKIIQNTMFPSAQNESIPFRFNENGDRPGNYDILNIRNENGSIRYEKVGSWSEGSLNFIAEPLFYRNGENVAEFQTACKGRCTECSTPDFTYVSLNGPIQIVGLAGVHDAGDHVSECGSLSNTGVMDVEAFLFAIDYVNAQDDILPGVQLGAKIFDTCQSGIRGIREVSSFFGNVGSFADRDEWQFMGGIISGGVPCVIESTYQVAEQYKHPQVVYTPSSPDLNDAEYLIKVSPTVSSQVQAILDLLQQYGWTFISVIADSSDKQQMKLYTTFIQTASDLCLDQNLLFTADTLDSTVSSLRGPANVVVMFASGAMINRIPKIVSYHNTFVFAGVGSHESVAYSDTIAGSLILSYNQRSASFEDLLNGQLAVSSVNNSRNPWLSEFISRKLSCNVGNITKFDSSCDDGASTSIDPSEIVNAKFIVNSVIALARSLSNVQKETCGINSGLCSDFVATDEETFLAAITRIDIFPDENGEQVVFENGQQQVNFSIWNVPASNGKNFVKVDVTSPTFVDENGIITGTVKSVCPPDETTPATTSPLASTSQATKSSETSKAGGETLAQRYEDFHDQSWFIIALILSGIGIIVTIIMMLIFFMKSDTVYAQCHSSFLVYLLLLAVLVMFLQTILFGLQVNVVICALRRIFPGVTFFTCFVCILLMSVRFFRVRKRENLGSGLGTKYIDNQSQIIAAACILPMESVILLQWLLYEPPSTQVVDENNVIHCTNINSTFSVSFLGTYILMVGSLVVSVLGLRRSKTHFSAELTSIIVCIAVSSIIAVAWILCSLLKDEGFLVAATAFAGIFQGFVVLVTIMPFIIRGLLRQEQFQVDSMSVIDGDSGFTNPVSVLDAPGQEAAPPTEKAKEAAAELKIAEDESHM